MFSISEMRDPFAKQKAVNPYEGLNMLTLHPIQGKGKARMELSPSVIEAMQLDLTDKTNRVMISLVTDKTNLALYLKDMGSKSAWVHGNRCFSSKDIYNLICDTYDCNKNEFTRFTLNEISQGNVKVWQILPLVEVPVTSEETPEEVEGFNTNENPMSTFKVRVTAEETQEAIDNQNDQDDQDDLADQALANIVNSY